MFILLSILLLLLAALLMGVLRVWRPSFGYHWLVALSGAFPAWLMVLITYSQVPSPAQIFSWGPKTAYPNSIVISIDNISWPYAVAIATLLLATLLSDVVRAYDLRWSNWASSLLIVAVSMLGIFSGNLLTCVLIWTAYDLIVMVIMLLQLDSEKLRRRTVQVFFIHLLGTMSLLLAGVVLASENNAVLLEQASPRAVLFILLAAGLRFGALPIDSQLQEDPNNRRSFGTVRSLASMAIVSVLLVRVASVLENVDFSGYLWPVLFALLALMAALLSLAWLSAKDELEGRQAWIMGFGLLIIASTLRAEYSASLSWGLAAIFTGGLIFLASVRVKISMWIALAGALMISTLPFTQTWSGLSLFSGPLSISLLIYVVAIGGLITGYVRHASRRIPEPSGLERWIRVIYPIGLAILPAAQIGVGLLYQSSLSGIPLSIWIACLLVILTAGLGYFWQRRGGKIPNRLVVGVNSLLSFHWLRTSLVYGFNQITRLLVFTTGIFEGEGGILWVILSIVIILTIMLIQLGI
jgi:hypothetical protein